MTLLDQSLATHARLRPDAIAIEPVVSAPITWRQLAARLAALHPAAPSPRLRELMLDHGADSVLAELAALRDGVPVLALPRFFTPEQVALARAACCLDVEGDGAPALPAGTARITFTSGSTGVAKGICLSAPHLLAVAGAVVEAVGAEHAGRHLAVLPPGILLETVAGLFATLLAGGTYVCPPQDAIGMGDPFRPDFPRLAAAIADLAITSLILVPEYLAGLVATMEAGGLRLPRLTIVAVGGARVPPALLARARAVGLPVRQGYGLTELGSVVSLERGDDAGPAGSAGLPLPHVGVRIAGDGEIVIDGPLFLGTIGGAPPASPWRTGDLGRIDADGRLWIEGRKSNLIVSSFGRNIAPEWLEETLLAQPGVLQACVWGDGLPAPRALLVAAHPDADLAEAVAAANAQLPAYARIGAWREVAAFTPDNGLLTGNGRLRRAAIHAAWTGAEPSAFLRLEAATFRARLRFLGVRQVRAGLAGDIGRETYLAYLAQAWHHVRHTVPLMQAARARLAEKHALVAALDDYIAEETGHDEWILADIAAAGGDAEAVRTSAPRAATAAMVGHAYRTIAEGNPAAFFGMVYVLESVSVALAQRGASAVAVRLGLPPEAFTYLTSHGALDRDHMDFFRDLVNGLDDPADHAAITAMAQDMFGLFGAVFASIPLEPAPQESNAAHV